MENKVEKTELKKEYVVSYKIDKPSLLISKQMVESLSESDMKSNSDSAFMFGTDDDGYLMLSKNEVLSIHKLK